MAMCRREKDELEPLRLDAQQLDLGLTTLGSAIKRIKAAEKALYLPRIYKRLAFPDKDDFDNYTTDLADRLREVRGRLQSLLDAYQKEKPKRDGGRHLRGAKHAAAKYAYPILVAYSKSRPTKTAEGPFYRLASAIYEGATGEEVDLTYYCRKEWDRREEALGASTMSRTEYHAYLRREMRAGEATRAAEITRPR
jgi:hypothetical protein